MPKLIKYIHMVTHPIFLLAIDWQKDWYFILKTIGDTKVWQNKNFRLFYMSKSMNKIEKKK